MALGATVFLGLLLSTPGHAQQPVSGTVVERGTERPLVGAQVSVAGTDLATLTDGNGDFELSEVPAGEVTLLVELIGYREAEVTVQAGATDVVIPLTEQAIALDDVIVTGTAGDQQARSIGNVVDRVQVSELRQVAPAQNVQEMLSAQAPGVRIMRTGGEVGTGGISRVRGASSISLQAAPIVYIDGVRVDGSDRTTGLGTFAFSGHQQPSRINDLNPEEIESIEVIKGPAAATLYGTEASNGVIQIITKQGDAQDPEVSLRMRQGAYWLPDPANTFPPVYFECQGVSQDADVAPRLQCQEGETVEVNVLEIDREVFGNEWFRTGQQPALGAEVRGGTESLRYFFSADWEREEGFVPYNWKNRLGGRANLSYVPFDQLTVDFNLGATRSRAQSASAQQPLSTAIIWACPAPGCEAGSGLPNALDGPFRGYIAYLPEVYEDEIEGFQDVDRLNAGLTLDHRPFPWFDHSLTVGGDLGNIRDSELYRATGSRGNFNPDGRKRVGHTRNTVLTVDYGANATWQVTPDLDLTTSAGAQYFERREEATRAHGEDFPLDAVETVTSGATRFAWEDFLENRTFGVYLQEQLGWRDRLYLTAAVRGDDNSAFGENFDFVAYPKFSASWVAGEERFLEDQDWLSTLRLRTAWGRAGQQPDVFDALRIYQPVQGPEGAAVVTPENIGNPDLQPEVSEELEIGFDAGLFNERLSLEFTRYWQRTTDALVRVPAVPSLGFPGFQFQNLAETRNSGIELGLRSQLYRSPTMSLDLGVNISSSSPEVADLGGQPPVPHSAFSGQYHVEGFPIAGIFHKRVVEAELAEENGRNVATNIMCEGGERVGDTNFSRGGGPPVPCDEAPEVYWGQPQPEWEGGVNASLTLFEDLRLYGLVDFIYGRTWINGDISGNHVFFLNSRAAVERDDPKMLAYQQLGADDGHDQTGIMSGDFAKLRTVSAEYQLPGSWAERVGASRLSVSVSGENLATLWQGDDERFGQPTMDPERHRQGGQTPGLSAYHQEGWPVGKRVTTSLRVTF